MNDQNVIQPNSAAVSHGYTSKADEERDSAKVMLLGGVAAGLVSGLMVLLSEREKQQETQPQSRLEQARRAIEEAAAKSRTEGKKATSDVSSSLSAFRGEATRKGKKTRKVAGKRGARLSKRAQKDADDTMAKITHLLAAAREEAGGAVRDVQKQAPDVNELAKQLRSRTGHAASDAKVRGRKLRAEAGKDAGKAKGEVNSLVSTLKTKAVDAEKVAESYLESSLMPKLKDLEKEASSMLETSKDKTKTTTHKIKEQAEKELIPQAKQGAEKLLKHAEEDLVPQARESVDKLKVTLGEQANVAAHGLEKGSADAAKVIGVAKEQVEKQAKDAGESVKRGTRETRSLLIWLGLAGTIVYNVFLNEEQQKKVKEIGMELFGEAKEMYSDMKTDGNSLSA